MGIKTYIEYVDEIEKLKTVFKLTSHQIFLLQIAAAFKVDDVDYDKLKEEFTNE